MITLDTLRTLVPAAFAAGPHIGVSDRYEFIPTLPIIRHVLERGWQIDRAWQSHAKRGSNEHSTHRIRFAPQQSGVGDLVPIVDLTNSHNRFCRLRLNAGINRCICRNGLVIPIAGMGERLTRIHIVGLHSAALDEAIDHALSAASDVLMHVEPMRERFLSVAARQEFALNAVALRFNCTTHFVPIYKPEWHDVLKPLRREDEAPTLWNTFNQMQEHLVNRGTLSRDRALTAPLAERNFNLALWNSAQSYMKQ